MEEVPAGEREKRGLIQLRNEMIYYLTAKPMKQEDGVSVNWYSLFFIYKFTYLCMHHCQGLLLFIASFQKT